MHFRDKSRQYAQELAFSKIVPQDDSFERDVCDTCGLINYVNPKLVAGHQFRIDVINEPACIADIALKTVILRHDFGERQFLRILARLIAKVHYQSPHLAP